MKRDINVIHAPSGARAAERLVSRFRSPLLQFFQRRVAAREDAEELAHDVFVKLLRRPDFSDIKNVEAFVFVTAANVLRDHYRKDVRRGKDAVPIDGLSIRCEAPTPEMAAERRSEIERLAKAVRELPPKLRVVFILHRIDGAPHSEIAGRLKITNSTVEKRLAAAMIHLKQKLKNVAEGGEGA